MIVRDDYSASGWLLSGAVAPAGTFGELPYPYNTLQGQQQQLIDWWNANYANRAIMEWETPPSWLEPLMQTGRYDELVSISRGGQVLAGQESGTQDITLGDAIRISQLPDTSTKYSYEQEQAYDWGLPVIAGEQPTQELVKGVTNMVDQPWMYSDVDYDITPQPSGFNLPNMGDWWQQNVVSPWNQFIGSGGAVQLPPNTQVGYAPAIGGIGAARAMLPAAKSAALAVSVPRAVGGTMRAGISAGAVVGLIARFGKPVMRAILGGLAVKEALDLVAGGAANDVLITWNPFRKAEIKNRRRYTFTVASSPHTIAKAAKAMKKVLRNHNKAIGSFLPKKVTYGIPPASALSTVEKRAIRSRK